jgi:group I intron endonuclease
MRNHPMFGLLGENNPRFGKKHSEETINKFKSKTHSEATKDKISKRLGYTIAVTDITTGVTTVYETIGKAADALDSSHSTISRYIKDGKLFRDTYKIENKPKK